METVATASICSMKGRTLLNHKAYQPKTKTPAQASSRNSLSKISRAYKQLTDSQMQSREVLAKHLKGISTFGKPLHINSGYRCPALNKALKGAKNSQHTKGQAADIASDNPHGLAELVLQKKLPFDQMILYSTFVHISHKHPGPQRGVVLYDEGYKERK